MALTSSRMLFLPRLLEQRQLRRYRQFLLEGNILTRSAPLLSHLGRLPLMVQPVDSADSPAAGAPMPLIEALDIAPRLRLVDVPSNGRALVLRQLCLQWAQGRTLRQVLPLLYRLPANEPCTITPIQLLQRELGRFGFEYDDLDIKRGLAAGLWLLLLEGWDELDSERRALWQTWLTNCAARYPALTMVVMTGPTPAPWPHFEDWRVQMIKDEG